MVEEARVLITEKPYFMTNKEWYYYDPMEMVCKLTDKAPQEAIDSYNEYYSDNVIEEDGESYIID